MSAQIFSSASISSRTSFSTDFVTAGTLESDGRPRRVAGGGDMPGPSVTGASAGTGSGSNSPSAICGSIFGSNSGASVPLGSVVILSFPSGMLRLFPQVVCDSARRQR